MNAGRRAAVVRAAILLLPFVLLATGIRFCGPAFSAWKRQRLLGDYAEHEVAGRAARYAVWTHERRGRAEAEQVAGAVDAFLAEACEPGAGFGLAPPEKPILIMLFEARADLEAFAGTTLKALLEENDGFYDPARHEIGVLREDSPPEHIIAALRHEAAHLLFDLTSPRGLSPWLTEGLACYFETRRDDRPAGHYGRTAASLLAAGKPLGVAEVLDADHKVFTDKDNKRAYAAAACTVAFLLDGAGPDLRARFLAHLASQQAGGPRGGHVLERALGIDAAELERRVTKWIAGSR